MAKTPTQLRSEAACKTVLKNLERRGFEAFYCSDKPAKTTLYPGAVPLPYRKLDC